MINVLIGVMLGPIDATVVALIIAIIRNAMGTGTILAFPGSLFGAFLVGFVYWYVWRTDHAAWVEIIGTTIIGALVGYVMLAGISQPTQVLGFIAARPLRPFSLEILGLAISLPAGAWALMAAFAVSDIPGCVLGFVVLKSLRRAGLVWA
jgi:energy-coupling factor transport system ATP-binding protein